MRPITTLLIFLLACAARPARAAVPGSRVEFIENRGQWDGRVRYAAQIATGARLFAETTGLTYALTQGLPSHHAPAAGAAKLAGRPSGQLAAHALRVAFVQPNPAATLTAELEAPGRHHYLHGTEPARWAAGTRAWHQLRYRQLWPGTDLIVRESATQQLEYDLLLAPGANPTRPRLRYHGATSLQLHPVTGSLLVQTSVGQLTEQRPQAWQLNPATGQRQPVDCAFQLRGEEISFQLGAYNRQLPLIIDPVVEFVSYTGSAVENWGYSATHDAQGNLYTAGVVFSAGYPTTTGAYQTSFSGNVDIAVMKFLTSATGPAARAWATHLGGDQMEFPHSLLVNGRGELLLLGTTSSTNYPTTAGALGRTFQGGPAIAPYSANSPFQLPTGADLVLTRLSANGGQLRASTYLGGTGTDGLLDPSATAPQLRFNYGDAFRGDLALDPAGNVYVASVTSSGNFPGVAAGALLGGTSDGVVTSLDSAFRQVRWSTLLGGAGADAAYSLQRDEASGDLLVAGGTTSANLRGAAGGYRAALAGDVDGFVARLTPGGTVSQATYLGTSSYDQAFFVRQGPTGQAYVLGQTLGAWPGLDPACYQTPGGRQFIQQLAGDLRTAGFATVFGSGRPTVDISPTAFGLDCYGRIFLAGWGGGLDLNRGSTEGLPITSNALQPGTDGMDFYLMQLSDQARQLDYATFFGSSADDHVDGGNARFDAQGVLYQALCACNDGARGIPVPPGANTYSPTNGAMKCNNAAFKLSFTENTTPAGPDSLTVCARGNALPLGGSPAGGTWSGTGVSGSPTTGYAFRPDTLLLGTHQLTYTSPAAANGCAGTSVRYVTVLPQRKATLTADTVVFCLQPRGPRPGRVRLRATPAGGTFTGKGVIPGTALFDPWLAGRGNHVITYQLAATGACPAVATLIMEVKGVPIIIPGPPLLLCADDPAYPLGGQPAGGIWAGNGVSGTPGNFVFTPSPALVGSHILTYTFVGDTDCDQVSDTLRVKVRPAGIKVQTPPDTTMCPTANRFRLRDGTPAGGTWTGNGVSGSKRLGFWFTPNPALTGSQSLTYTVPSPDTTACPGQASRIVNLQAGTVALSAPDTVLCATSGAQFLTAFPAGGIWSGPGVTGSVATGFIFTPSAALVGLQSLGYVAPSATNPAICPASGRLRLRVLATPFVYLAPVAPINFCLSSPPHGVVLTAVPLGGTYAGPGVVGNRFNPAQAGPGRHALTYTIVIPGVDCPIISTQIVEVNLLTAIQLPPDTVLCVGSRAPFQLRAAPASGVWSGPGVTPEGRFTPPIVPGTTVLTYTLPDGCGAQPYRVTVPTTPTFTANWLVPDCPANELAPRRLRFQATGPLAAQVQWDFGDGSEKATGASVEHTYAVGRYVPQVVLPPGAGPADGLCLLQQTLAAVVVQAAVVPNIITPNADNLNDTFAPRIGGCTVRLQVFSRWGQRVFEQADYHNDWRGAGLPGGLYYYLLTPANGAVVKGWVEIMR